MKTSMLLGLAAIVIGTVSIAAGQQPGNLAIKGQIVDVNGAVVPGAVVVATQKETGLVRKTTTDPLGAYLLDNLPLGSYQVTASAPGFAKATVTEPIFDGRTATVYFTMSPDTHYVLDDPMGWTDSVQADSSSSAISSDAEDRQTDKLPLNSRELLALALLIEGNSPAGIFGSPASGHAPISATGLPGRATSVTIDGADNNNDLEGGALLNLSLDAEREVRISTNGYQAELGRSASSVIEVGTAGGQNIFFGSAAVYERDRRFQGLPATFDRSLPLQPAFDRQQYVVSLGGPLRKDKLFWFSAFEFRNEDGLDQVGFRDLNTRSIGHAAAPAPVDDVLGTARLDWAPTFLHTFALRFSMDRQNGRSFAPLQRGIGTSEQQFDYENRSTALFAKWLWTFSPNAVNELFVDTANLAARADPTSELPQMNFPGIQTGSAFRVLLPTRQKKIEFNDTFDLIRGNHAFKFGFDVQRTHGNIESRFSTAGQIDFVQDFAELDRNGDGHVDDGDLLLLTRYANCLQ